MTAISRIRVIGGQWRGRRIAVPDGMDSRPTLNQHRETLFNWLGADVQDARCLDLFAGSGALGFEALSRGAAQAVLVERAPRGVAVIRENGIALAAGTRLTVARADAFRWLARCDGVFDLIFLDPPWGLRAVPRLLERIAADGLLATAGLVYFEAAQDDDFEVPEPWRAYRDRKSGPARHGLLTLGDGR